MSFENSAEKEVIDTHPDGHRAVVTLKTKGKTYYKALGPDGLCVGVYDVEDEAKSAAQWAWDFLEDDPAIRRLALMQLILEKLALQYPLESAEIAMSPKG